jgi:hypothetical protein
MPNPTRIEICCDKECPNYLVEQVVELTDAEVAQMEADAVAAATAQAEREAAEAAAAEAKASAQAKLAALGLTADEIAALSK